MTATGTSIIASSTLASTSASVASSTTKIASMPALPPGEEIYDLMGTFSMSYPWGKLLIEIIIVIFCKTSCAYCTSLLYMIFYDLSIRFGKSAQKKSLFSHICF